METKPIACEDPGRLRALLEDRLGPEEQAALTGHIASCVRCRTALERMAAESDWWDDARQLAGETESLRRERTITPPPEFPSFAFLDPPSGPGYIGRFGPYDVIEFIGQGGSGLVFKALDPTLHRLVAIKVLAPQLAANATARLRFLREARAAASVTHDHVVTIHAVDEANGLPYLVMQYIPGKSLEDRIKRSGPLELREILRIGMQAASGLAAAHAQGLIHRDVKPANILLENGIERVKLTDFGLARAVDDASLTQSGVIAGTPQYMAPEQARGEAVDPRADQFGLGCVLYTMATGHSPFRAATTMAVLRRVCDEAPRPIRDANPEAPPWLAEIVDRLLAKNPADRYASAAEVCTVLSGHLARLQQPSIPTAPVESEETPEPAQTRARWIRGLEAAVVILAGLFVVTEALGYSHVMEYVATVLRIRTRHGTLVLDIEDPEIAVKLDGEDVVITGAGPRELRLRPGPHLVVASKDGQQDQASITIERGGRRSARIQLETPDRPRIALEETRWPNAPANAAPTELRKRSDRNTAANSAHVGHPPRTDSEPPSSPQPVGEKVLAIEPPPAPEPAPRVQLAANGTIWDIAYSPDSRYLAVIDASGKLSLHEPNTRNPERPNTDELRTSGGSSLAARDGAIPFRFSVKLEGFSALSRIAFAPDAKRLAVSRADGVVTLWDVSQLVSGESVKAKDCEYLDSGSPVPMSAPIPATHLAFSPDGKLLATGGGDGKVAIWNPNTRKRILNLPTGQFSLAVADLAFAPDDQTLAISRPTLAKHEQGVHLWRITGSSENLTADPIGIIPVGIDGAFAKIGFDPKLGLLATYGVDLPTVFWNLTERKGLQAAVGPDCWSLRFSADGSLLAAAHKDGGVSIWDRIGPRDFQSRTTFRAGRAAVQHIALSPDGKSLATAEGGHPFHVLVWDVPAKAQSRPVQRDESRSPASAEQSSADRPVYARPGAITSPGSASPRELAKALLDQAEHRLASAKAAELIALDQVALAKAHLKLSSEERERVAQGLTPFAAPRDNDVDGGRAHQERLRTLRSVVTADLLAAGAARTADARAEAARRRVLEAGAERDLAKLNLQLVDGRTIATESLARASVELARSRKAVAEAEKTIATIKLETAKIDHEQAVAERKYREAQKDALNNPPDPNAVSNEDRSVTAARTAERVAESKVNIAEAELEFATELLERAERPEASPQQPDRATQPRNR
jgi:serine/threonine protein kinase/WD40 repeat protein